MMEGPNERQEERRKEGRKEGGREAMKNRNPAPTRQWKDEMLPRETSLLIGMNIFEGGTHRIIMT